jgi:hypothetical protein
MRPAKHVLDRLEVLIAKLRHVRLSREHLETAPEMREMKNVKILRRVLLHLNDINVKVWAQDHVLIVGSHSPHAAVQPVQFPSLSEDGVRLMTEIVILQKVVEMAIVIPAPRIGKMPLIVPLIVPDHADPFVVPMDVKQARHAVLVPQIAEYARLFLARGLL